MALLILSAGMETLGRNNRRPQTRISVRIAAASGSDRNFFNKAREYFSALGVEGGFFVLDGRPFRMT